MAGFSVSSLVAFRGPAGVMGDSPVPLICGCYVAHFGDLAYVPQVLPSRFGRVVHLGTPSQPPTFSPLPLLLSSSSLSRAPAGSMGDVPASLNFDGSGGYIAGLSLTPQVSPFRGGGVAHWGAFSRPSALSQSLLSPCPQASLLAAAESQEVFELMCLQTGSLHFSVLTPQEPILAAPPTLHRDEPEGALLLVAPLRARAWHAPPAPSLQFLGVGERACLGLGFSLPKACSWRISSGSSIGGGPFVHVDYDLLKRRRRVRLSSPLTSRWSSAVSMAWQVSFEAVVPTAWAICAAAVVYKPLALSLSLGSWVSCTLCEIVSTLLFTMVLNLRALLFSLGSWMLYVCGASFAVTFRLLQCLWLAYLVVGLAHFVFTQLGGRLVFWGTLFARFVLGSCVCLSCAGNDPNCKGDNTCVLACALVANAAVMAGTVGAAVALSMGGEGKHILPLSWLQFLKPSVLQTLVRLAQKSPTGTPLDVPSLSLRDLSAQISGGVISVSDGRLEFLRRMSVDGVTEEDMRKMKLICDILPQRADESRSLSSLGKVSQAGALQFVFAFASQVVYKLSSSTKFTLSVGEASSSSSSSFSVELKRPQSSEAFSYTLTVWQSILCATGLANSVIIGPFLAEVVYDVMLIRGWKVALEHFLLYIQKIDSGCGWHLATATSLGSHDTFLHKAVRAAGDLGEDKHTPHLLKPPLQVPSPPKVAWNGRFTTDSSARPCAAYNLGQAHQRLLPDGTCPFNHVCDQWVTDQGKSGQCKGAHVRASCTNKAKAKSAKSE